MLFVAMQILKFVSGDAAVTIWNTIHGFALCLVSSLYNTATNIPVVSQAWVENGLPLRVEMEEFYIL